MTSNESGPNVDLLRATMDEILAHPEQHKQSSWAHQSDCSTAYCFAGMVCLLSGREADFTRGWVYEGGRETLVLIDGGVIAAEAQDLLGIDLTTAATLFAEDNTTADLKHYVDEIAEHGRIIEAVR